MAETKKQADSLKFYNTAEKRVEEFESREFKKVKMYNCGPTVYNYPTIGNLRTYINVDVLRRVLEYMGYAVEETMNITDIEDKIIRDMKKAGLNPADAADRKKFTAKFEKAFYDNLADLNVEPAEHTPHATDPKVISRMIEIIQKLLTRDLAYVADDGVYFDISRFRNYGKLSGVKLAGNKAGVRVAVDEYDKENAQDFALWKAVGPGEPSWDAPFGAGRPGWHIECSAMAGLYLGDTIDIHAGGVDLIFPHHENEIAQTESYTGKKFAHYWFHGEHLLVEGQRMGKSQNNFYLLSDLEKKFKAEPLAFRMLCISSHYRDKLNFTHSNIADAQNTLDNLRSFVLRLQVISKSGTKNRIENIIKKSSGDFRSAVSDDLAMPKALAVLFDFIKKVNSHRDLNTKEAGAVLTAIMDFDRVLGLRLSDVAVVKIPANVLALAKKREEARVAKDYKGADFIRKSIEKSGFEVEDTAEGPIVRKR